MLGRNRRHRFWMHAGFSTATGCAAVQPAGIEIEHGRGPLRRHDLDGDAFSRHETPRCALPEGVNHLAADVLECRSQREPG
jgi:hypothetical protein